MGIGCDNRALGSMLLLAGHVSLAGGLRTSHLPMVGSLLFQVLHCKSRLHYDPMAGRFHVASNLLD